MPTLNPYRLTFRSGIHLGARGINLEETGHVIPSDTLFSALVDTWRLLAANQKSSLESFVKPFLDQSFDPPFLLTSAFPFAGQVLFFPMPASLERVFTADTLHTRGKTLKRIRYFSLGLLEKAMQGQRLDEHLFPIDEWEQPKQGAALQGGALWLGIDELAKLPDSFQLPEGRQHALRRQVVWTTEQVPRVAVGRTNQAPNLFHVGRTDFSEGCGLWFGVQWRKNLTTLGPGEPTFEQALRLTLSLLGDAGIGGERTYGFGAFSFNQDMPIGLGTDPQPHQPALLLSRYHPTSQELPAALASPAAQYQLEAVGGWLNSPDAAAQRRKRLYMVSPGSVVTPNHYPAGDVCDVKPEYENKAGEPLHPVYRYGLACALKWLE